MSPYPRMTDYTIIEFKILPYLSFSLTIYIYIDLNIDLYIDIKSNTTTMMMRIFHLIFHIIYRVSYTRVFFISMKVYNTHFCLNKNILFCFLLGKHLNFKIESAIKIQYSTKVLYSIYVCIIFCIYFYLFGIKYVIHKYTTSYRLPRSLDFYTR